MTSTFSSPLGWFGGKTMLGPQILPYFPAHHTYIEVFGGSGAMLFQKQPSRNEVYNDVNDRLVNFWRIMKDQPFDLMLECQRIGGLDARTIFTEYLEPSPDPLEDAARFLYVNKLSFSQANTSYHGIHLSGNKSKIAFDNILSSFQQISTRLKLVSIESQDFRKIFQRFDKPEVFFYVDPPYVQGGENYEKGIGGKAWTSEDLKDCLDICNNLEGRCCISLDKAELCPSNYHILPISRINSCDGFKGKDRCQTITEYLFVNYDETKIYRERHKNQTTLFRQR